MKHCEMLTVKLLISFVALARDASGFLSQTLANRHASTILRSSDSDNVVGNDKGKVVLLIPSIEEAEAKRIHFGTNSPIGNPSVLNGAEHLSKKIVFFSEDRVMATVLHNDMASVSMDELVDADVLIAMYLSTDKDLEIARRAWELRRNSARRGEQCSISYACECEGLDAIVGPLDSRRGSIVSTLVPWSKVASALRLSQQMEKLLGNSSDEFVFAVMLFFQQFSRLTIPWVQYTIDATWEKGALQNGQELYSLGM